MQVKPTYEELEQRCQTAEAILDAIRSGQTDMVVGEKGPLVLRLEKELADTRVLYTLSQRLNELDILEDAVQQAADLVAETLHFDRLNIITFDMATEIILHFYSGGPGRRASVEVSFDELQEGLSGWVLRTRQSALSPQGVPDERESPAVQERRHATDCGAIMVVPILSRNTILGTITAINRPEQRDFTQADVELLETLASQVGVLIQNNQLYHDLHKEVKLRQQTQGKLEKAYLEQEQRVKNRTAQLAEKNQALEQEIQARKKTEQVLQLFVEYAPAAIAMFDREMRYIATSRRFLADYRLTEQNVVGRSHYDLFPELSERVKEVHRRCLAGAVEKAEEDPFPREDGGVDWVRWEIHPWYESSGEIGGIILFSEVITERKLALERLQDSEERFRTTFEAMLEGTQMIDFDWRYLYLNATAEKHNRRPNQELLGQCYMDMWPGIEETPVFAILKDCMDTRTAHHIENEFVYPDGLIRWFELSIQPVPEGIFILSIDITERKRAENDFQDILLNLESAEEQAALGSWYFDTATQKGWWSKQMYQIFGLDPANGVPGNEDYLALIHPEDRALLALTLAQLSQGFPPEKQTYRICLPNGETRILNPQYRIEKDASGKILKFYGTIFDITERIQAEEALRKSESLLTEAQAIGQMGHIEWNGRDQALICSEEIYSIFGLPPGTEITQNTISSMMLPEELEELQRLDLEAFAHRGNLDYEYRIRLPNGEIRWLHQHGKVTYNEQNIPIRMIAVCQDITERKRVENELRRSNAELEQFAYVASHDLQEPLRALAGMVQLLEHKYKGQLDDRADEYIHHAVDAAYRMQKLINDLLAFSRVDRQGRSFTMVDAAACLKTALKDLEVAAQESEATITWDALPKVFADGIQLTQLFQNLLGNSLKFRGNRPPEIHISAVHKKGVWQFAVRDNGIGIEPQYYERIFQLFQRLHTRREYTGTGIGLAICKKIVERHGGQIWVESQPEQGATFYFTLPGKEA